MGTDTYGLRVGGTQGATAALILLFTGLNVFGAKLIARVQTVPAAWMTVYGMLLQPGVLLTAASTLAVGALVYRWRRGASHDGGKNAVRCFNGPYRHGECARRSLK